MISDLRTALTAAEADGPTIRLLRSVFSAVPEQARLGNRGGLSGLLAEPATPRVIREDLDVSGAASDIAAALDRGELLNAVAVTPRVALSLYDAHLEWALGVGELEREQSRDASVRLHGIGLLAQRLFEGSTPERAGELLSYEAGRAMLIWFIAVELVLPVSTEDEPATSQQLRDLLDQHGEAVIQDLNHLASRADREGGQEVIRAMLGVISPVVQVVADAVPGVAGAVRRALPELVDNGQEALAAEANQLGIYTLLTARLVAEIEAERLEEELPLPPAPAPKNNEEIEAMQARLEAAEARWDPEPIAAAQSALKHVDSQLASLDKREAAHKKSLRAVKRKLARTVDRRARLAEAPPAGQAEAEAAEERAVSALKEAEKHVKKAVRQLGTREERVVAAKAALKHRDQILEQQRQVQREAEAEAEALQLAVSKLQAEDEAQAEEIKKAVVAQAEAQALAQVDMEARLEVAKARCAAIDVEVPQVRETLSQIGAQLLANKGALSALSENREGLADTLVLAREAQPEQQSERKAKAEVLAQAQVSRERATEKLKAAATVVQRAASSLSKVEKVAAKARERLSALDDDVKACGDAAEHAAGVVSALQAQIHQGEMALKANAAAQAAGEAAQAAARSEASSAVQRALAASKERHAELTARAEGLSGAMGEIQGRQAAHTVAVKELDVQRKSLQSDLVQARAERDARMKLIDEHLKQVLAKDSTLGKHEGELPSFVKASRKAAAVHSGAAARVVGARDALSASIRRVSEAEQARDGGVSELGELDAAVQAKKKEIAAIETEMAAGSSKSPSGVEELLAQIKPSSVPQTGRAVKPPPTVPEDASDDAATAMFTPDALQARLLREQEEEDAANATVMFARKKQAPVPNLKSEPEEDEEDATVMFTLDELRARAAAEEEEEALPDDETVIFLRPTKDD